MARRTATALLALVAFAYVAGVAQATFTLDGGMFCRYVNIRQVRTEMLKINAGTSVADINTQINNLKNTNNWICKVCLGPAFKKTNADKVIKGYGQCQCNPNGEYGYSNHVNKDGKVTTEKIGCMKCPAGKTAKAPAVGPYTSKPASGVISKWSGTPCT